MTLRLVVPSSGGESDVPEDEDGIRGYLDRLYDVQADEGRDNALVRLNMITSIDGSAAGSDGTSDSLTNRIDRILLAVLRRRADVVLVGAASVRREGYRMPRRARLAIVTSSGDLGGHRMSLKSDTPRLLVFCPERAHARVVESTLGLAPEIVMLPAVAGRVDIPSVMSSMRNLALVHVLCEGGPLLASQLLDNDLVDEICLTTAPTIAGKSMPVFGDVQRAHEARLASLLIDDDQFTFARWMLRPLSPLSGDREPTR